MEIDISVLKPKPSDVRCFDGIDWGLHVILGPESAEEGIAVSGIIMWRVER